MGTGKHVAGLEGTESNGGDRRNVWFVNDARVRINTCGDVDGEDGGVLLCQFLHDGGGGFPDCPFSANTHNAVNCEGAAFHCHRHCVLVVDGYGITKRILECGEPGGVGAVRVEEDGGDGHSPPAQEGATPESVSPIVAGSHQQQHPVASYFAGVVAEFLDGVGVEAVGGPLHEIPFW